MSGKAHDPAHTLRLLTQAQICIRFGISDECWRRWRKAQLVPLPVALPGRPRWRVSDIEAFEQGQSGRRFFTAAKRGNRHVA